MKSINIKAAFIVILVSLLAAGCSKILEEQPRSSFTPDYFKTEKGVLGGITSMYAHLRWIYGQAYYYNSCITASSQVS